MLKAAIIGGFFVCKNNKKNNKWYIKIKNKNKDAKENILSTKYHRTCDLFD